MRAVVSILVVFSMIFSHSAELLAGKGKSKPARSHEETKSAPAPQATRLKVKQVALDQLVNIDGFPKGKFSKDKSTALVCQSSRMIDRATQVAVHSNGALEDTDLINIIEAERALGRKCAMGNYQDLKDIHGNPLPYTPTPYNREYCRPPITADTIFNCGERYRALYQLETDEKVKSYVYHLKRFLLHMIQNFLVHETDDKFLKANVEQFSQSKTSIFLSQQFYDQLPERVITVSTEWILDKDGVRKYLNTIYLMKLNAQLMEKFYALLFESKAFHWPAHLRIIQEPTFAVTPPLIRQKQPFEEFQSKFITQYQRIFYQCGLNGFLDNEALFTEKIKPYTGLISALVDFNKETHLMMQITYRDYLRNLLIFERLRSFLNFIQTESIPVPKLTAYPRELKQLHVVVFKENMSAENVRQALQKGLAKIQDLIQNPELSKLKGMFHVTSDLMKQMNAFLCNISCARESAEDDSYLTPLPDDVSAAKPIDTEKRKDGSKAFKTTVEKDGIPQAQQNIGYYASQWLLLNIFANNLEKVIDSDSLKGIDGFLIHFCGNPFYGQDAHNFPKLKGYFELHEMTEVAFRLYREGSNLFLQFYRQMRHYLYQNLPAFKESGVTVEDLEKSTFILFFNNHFIKQYQIEFLITQFENLYAITRDQGNIDFYSASLQYDPTFYHSTWKGVIENTPDYIAKLLRFCATRLILLRTIQDKLQEVLGPITPQSAVVSGPVPQASPMEVENAPSFLEGELLGAQLLLDDEKRRNNLLQSEIATLKEEVVTLKMQMLNLGDTKTLEAEIGALKKTVLEKEKEIQTLRTQGKSNQEKIAQYSADIKALKADRETLEQAHAEKVKTLNQQMAASNTEKNKFKREAESLRAEITATKSELERMTSEIERKETTIQNLKGNNKKIIDDIQTKHKAEIDGLKARIQELQVNHLREVETVQNQLTSAHARIAELEGALKDKDHEIAGLGQTNTARANLIQQLMESEAQVDANNVGFATALMESYNNSGPVPFGQVRIPQNAQSILWTQYAEINDLIAVMSYHGHNEALSALLLGNNAALLQKLEVLNLRQTRLTQALRGQYEELQAELKSTDPELTEERRVEIGQELRDLQRQMAEIYQSPPKRHRRGKR